MVVSSRERERQRERQRETDRGRDRGRRERERERLGLSTCGDAIEVVGMLNHLQLDGDDGAADQR